MMRVRIISLTITVIFLFIGSGILELEIIQGKKFRYLGEKNCIRLLSQDGARGRILDRRGEVIVDNELSYDANILPSEKIQIDKTLTAVSRLLGTGFKDLKDKFKKDYSAPFIPVVIAKNIDIRKAIALEELKSDYNSIFVQPRPSRIYPHKKLACHVVGYLNEIDHWRLTKLKDYGYKTKDIVGFGGVEEKYDYYLRQSPGALSVEVDHRCRFVRVLGFRPPKNGQDIQLTLSLQAQKIVEDVLGDRKGSVILMEPYTGEVIAMASSPNFDPSVFVNGTYSSANLADSALINRAISGAYSLGSIFKLVTACAGIETGKINPSTIYYCSGRLRIGNREFGCWDTHHEENMAEAITHSCDIFFYRVGLASGPQILHDYASKFGLSKPTTIDLPYEANGFVPDPLWKRIYKFQNWFDGDTANFAIGQGYLLVTPMQVARLMAAFANKGALVIPYVVKNIGGRDMSGVQKKSMRIPIKEDIINNIRQDLRRVVSESSGTANALSDLAVPIAGKTGTAQFSRNLTHGWFAGFFPFNNPKFVICVFLENSGSGHAASVLAKQIIEGMIKENLI